MSIKIRFLKNQKTKIISAFDTILDCDIDSLKLNINNENVFSFINNKTICTAIIKEYDKSREFFYEHYDVQFLNDISYNYNFNTKHREYCILYIDDIEISGGLCALKRITEQNNILYFEIEILNQIEDLYEKSKGIQLNELGNYNIIWNEDNIKTLLSDEINGFSLVPLNDGESVRQDSINTSIKTIFDTNTIPVAINVNKILNDGLSKLGLSIRDNSFLNSEYINNLWIFDNKSEILEFYQEESQKLLDISYEDISYNSIEKYTIKSIESFIGMTGMTGMTGLEYSIYTKKYNSNISPLNIEKKENEKYNFTYKYINTEYDSNFSDYTNKNISSITLVGNTKYNIKINNIDCIINSTNDIDIYRIHTILKFKNTKTNEDEIYNFYSDITPIGTTTNLNIEFEKYIKDNTIVTIYSQEELGILFSNENDKEYDFNITKNIFSYSLKIEKIKNDKIRIIGEELNLFSQIPNISLYDVLSGLQQMFNLVFKITDNTIDAIPLKNYYDKSKYINIDKYVNYDKEIIIKPSIDEFKYNNISLKYDVNKADYYNLYSYLYDNREYGEYKSSIETYNKDKINIKNPLSICKTGTYKYNNLLEFTSSFNINNENLLKVTPSKCFIGYKELKTFDIPLDTIYLYYDENNYNSYNQNKYNIFTHICSAIDYCYDTPKFIFFKTTEYQQKNLFSEFFYENIQENISEQGKIITLFANINIETLQQLYSINVVYYKNIYWKLLEIKNWQYYDNNVILKLLKIIDIENINLNNKKIIKIDINQNYLKPILIDEQFLSGNFLNELSDNAAIISTSKELFNLHDILLDISNLQEGISGASGIYEEINEINNEINLINTDISGIHLAITGINTDLSGIHSAISGINTDLSGIHLAITGINTDINNINTDLSDIHLAITGINTNINNINTDLSGIHSSITGINTNINNINAVLTKYFTLDKYLQQNFITYLEKNNFYVNLNNIESYNLLTALSTSLESYFMQYYNDKINIDLSQLQDYTQLKAYIEHNITLDVEHKDSIFITYQGKIYIFNYTDSTFTLIYTQPGSYTISDLYYCKESTYYNALPTLYFIANGTLWNLEKGSTTINCTKFIIYNHELFVFYDGTITRYDTSGRGTNEATDVNVDDFFAIMGTIFYWDVTNNKTYNRQNGIWIEYYNNIAVKNIILFETSTTNILVSDINGCILRNKLFVFKSDGIYQFITGEQCKLTYTISGNIIKASCTEDYAYIYTDANKLYKFDGDILTLIGTYDISGILAIDTKDTKFKILQDTTINNIQFGNNVQSMLLKKFHGDTYEFDLQQNDNYFSSLYFKKLAVKSEIKHIYKIITGNNPDEISGLKIWLKADYGIVKGANNRVSAWNDASGNGYVFNQSNPDKLPLYIPSIDSMNHKPAIEFQNDELQCWQEMSIGTIFVVANYSHDVFQTYAGLFTRAAYDNTHLSIIFSANAGSTNFYYAPLLEYNIYINNTQTYNFAPLPSPKICYGYIASGTPCTWPDAMIGRDRYDSNRFWEGDVYELIIYDRVLSFTEIEKVKNYLKEKYAMDF